MWFDVIRDDLASCLFWILGKPVGQSHTMSQGILSFKELFSAVRPPKITIMPAAGPSQQTCRLSLNRTALGNEGNWTAGCGFLFDKILDPSSDSNRSNRYLDIMIWVMRSHYHIPLRPDNLKTSWNLSSGLCQQVPNLDSSWVFP